MLSVCMAFIYVLLEDSRQGCVCYSTCKHSGLNYMEGNTSFGSVAVERFSQNAFLSFQAISTYSSIYQGCFLLLLLLLFVCFVFSVLICFIRTNPEEKKADREE